MIIDINQEQLMPNNRLILEINDQFMRESFVTFKGALSQGFRRFLAQTILKLVVATLIHS